MVYDTPLRSTVRAGRISVKRCKGDVREVMVGKKKKDMLGRGVNKVLLL